MTDINQMPWDRFPEEEELPYKPPKEEKPSLEEMLEHVRPLNPAPTSTPPTGVSPPEWKDVLDEAWPVIRDQVVDYAKAVVSTGGKIDHAHPTIVATTAEGKKLVVADARNRSARTLIQGLIFDLFAALVAAVALLSGLDPLQKETWIAFGVLLTKSFVSAGISYFMRLRVTPTVRSQGEKMQVMPVMVPEAPKDGA